MPLVHELPGRVRALSAVGVAATAVAVVVLAVRGPAARTIPTHARQSPHVGVVGRTLPAVSAVSLDGRPVTTAIDPPRPLVIVVWRSGCTCAGLFRVAGTLAQSSRGRYAVVGFSMDDDPGQAARTALDAHLGFPSALDPDGRMRGVLGPRPQPELVLAGSDRRVGAVFGADVTLADAAAALGALR